MAVRVFWIEPVAMIERSLRRYKSGSECPIPGRSYHNESYVIGRDISALPGSEDYDSSSMKPADYEGDPRWPTHCDCGYAFQPDDTEQCNEHRLYAGAPDNELYTLQLAPVGAMWDAWWMSTLWKGPDGITLCVRTPGGDWMVDGEASNCTRSARTINKQGYRESRDRDHWCWVRHGDPRTGELHIDKNGDTCAAGAGSIQVGNYHGFLHHGYLT